MKRAIRYYNRHFNVKKSCTFCDDTFYAKSISALYCSDSHKQRFYTVKKKLTQDPYYDDINNGKRLAPGTMPSLDMPEDKVVFIGDLKNLQSKLAALLSEQQLMDEMRFINKLKPITVSLDWYDSYWQIFTEEDLMGVFRVSPKKYKLYIWPWESENEKPF